MTKKVKNFESMLKLFQEWGKGEIKENYGGSEFNYDLFDIL
jgi:hypothetical protein